MVYCVPSDAEELLMCRAFEDGSGHLPASVLALPQHFRLHYVAAELSRWVYAAEEPPPRVAFGSEAVAFEVHEIENDPQRGIATRVATVTALIPGMEPTLFIVFRGTDDLHDLLTDLQLAPDYAEVGDGNTFVHGGMSTLISNLGIFHRANFLRRLVLAFRSGVRHCVVTGHSLGGAYAMMLLFKVAQRLVDAEDVPDEARPLLTSLGCVSFGAPMIFGLRQRSRSPPSWVVECLRGRAVNYVVEDDPIPRCYSEVELDSFLDAIGGQLKTGTGGWFPLKDAVVDAIIASVKNQGVLAQYKQVAQLYVHLCRLHLLCYPSKDRSEQEGSYSFEDHAMTAYLDRIRSALGAKGTEEACRIYRVEAQRLL